MRSSRRLLQISLGSAHDGAQTDRSHAFYIDYQGRRWFSNGRAVLLDPAKLARSGEYHGFAVYASDAPAETIYVAVTNTTSGLLTPYSTRK